MARRKQDTIMTTIRSPLRAFEKANLAMKMLITAGSAYLLWRKFERDQEEDNLRQMLLTQAQSQAGFAHAAQPMTGPGVTILPTQGTPTVEYQGIAYDQEQAIRAVTGPVIQALSS